jgi:hypothetical protein
MRGILASRRAVLSLRMARVFVSALLLLFVAIAVRAEGDGPYVLRDSAGAWQAVSIEESPVGPRKSTRPAAIGDTLMVGAVGKLPAFGVKLRALASPAADTITAPQAPLFVVADSHGEYEILVALLQKHGIVDAKLRWSFGRGHLVILGDVFDRGPNQTEILWLLYELEAQAAKARGGAHLVLGNHETMIMMGDLRYLNPKYVATVERAGVASYAALYGPDTLLGAWLRSRPAVLRINDQLCLHAGIARALVDSGLTLAQINAGVRAVLGGNVADTRQAELLFGSDGPLWYRGYFAEQTTFTPATPADIDLALQKFGVRRILIGHTIVPSITSLFAGKVLALNVYPKRDDGGTANYEALLIKQGQTSRATLHGVEPLR